jgi:radical SAM superfamily enzyme YgiQ (UPF0313 family)
MTRTPFFPNRPPCRPFLLSTLNARYFHSSFGLRYLLANMGELQPDTAIREFIITQRPLDIAEALLAEQPRIVGFGVYIWNVAETTQVVALLKRVRPDLVIVLGGPEVSHEWEEQPIVQLADYLVTGPADLAFAQLCRRLLADDPPTEKVIAAATPPLDQLASAVSVLYRRGHRPPADLRRSLARLPVPVRVLSVGAGQDRLAVSAGAVSGRDATAPRAGRAPLQIRGSHLQSQRKIGARILDFFLERLDERLFLHFELIPDHLPEPLKERIARFPPGALQFEIGVQTFNPAVQALISRKQDNRKTEDNLVWLRRHTHAHLHADLIVGLPGEDLASFAAGFNRLVALDPHEIQVGILKRLRGAPIARHTAEFDCRYNPHPPYNLLCSALLDFATLRRLERFARFWDLIGNSGRFRHARPLLLGDRSVRALHGA